jgi:hypothetical protein
VNQKAVNLPRLGCIVNLALKVNLYLPPRSDELRREPDLIALFKTQILLPRPLKIPLPCTNLLNQREGESGMPAEKGDMPYMRDVFLPQLKLMGIGEPRVNEASNLAIRYEILGGIELISEHPADKLEEDRHRGKVSRSSPDLKRNTVVPVSDRFFGFACGHNSSFRKGKRKQTFLE